MHIAQPWCCGFREDGRNGDWRWRPMTVLLLIAIVLLEWHYVVDIVDNPRLGASPTPRAELPDNYGVALAGKRMTSNLKVQFQLQI